MNEFMGLLECSCLPLSDKTWIWGNVYETQDKGSVYL